MATSRYGDIAVWRHRGVATSRHKFMTLLELLGRNDSEYGRPSAGKVAKVDQRWNEMGELYEATN
jgi:hypothetical protein